MDPATASFITKDPAKADGEESAYQYCGGDPVGKVDPSGEVSLKTLKRYYSEVLNADERKVANRYWYQLASYYTAYKEAIQIKGEDNKGDALRHAYWNALLTRMLGSTSAKRWTDAHETGDRRNKFNQRAMRMDLHNNKVGRDIAKKYPYGTKKDVKNWIQQSGRLVWFGHGV